QLELTMMKPDHHDPNNPDNTRPWRKQCSHLFTTHFGFRNEEIKNILEIKVYEAGSQEEIFSSEAWRRATKKVVKFRLCGRAHSLTLLEFARRLDLYHSGEVNEEGFNVYFLGGLHSDDNFNARDYCLSISSVEELQLSRILASIIRSPILRVLQKMITYGLCQRTIGYDKVQKNKLWLMSMFEAKHQNGYANMAWLMVKCLKRKGIGSQKDSMICCGQVITRIAKKMRLLIKEVLNSLSAPTYCRALDTTTLRELINSEGFNLYDRMGSMEIRQGAIERMAYRQSYHWDWYHGVFEHMAEVYDVSLHGVYNPPGYDQQQYQYYQ
ncbi:hypothetical protein Tco_1374634, partial [Tanacetum coccineum]